MHARATRHENRIAGRTEILHTAFRSSLVDRNRFYERLIQLPQRELVVLCSTPAQRVGVGEDSIVDTLQAALPLILGPERRGVFRVRHSVALSFAVGCD